MVATIVTSDYKPDALRENFNAVLKTQQGLLVTKVFETEIVPYENPLWPVVPAGGFVDFFIPRDAVANEIFRVERPGTISQIFQGWAQPNLKIFMRIPQGTPRGVHPNPRIGNPAINTLPPFGWILQGFESPKDSWTRKGEFFILPYLSYEFGFINPEGFDVKPNSNHLFNNFNHIPYDPREASDHEVIMRILKGSIPARIWSPGIEPFPFNSFTTRFEVPPIQFNGKKAWYDVGGDSKEIGRV
jgi:hypothetical protein